MANDNIKSLYLSEIQASGFKSIDNLCVDFDKNLNIIIGKNGVGKSNFLELLYLSLSNRNLFRNRFLFNEITYKLISKENGKTFKVELSRELEEIFVDEKAFFDRSSIYKIVYLDEKEVYSDRKISDDNTINISRRLSLRGFFRELGYYLAEPKYLKYNIPDRLDFLESSGTLRINIERPNAIELPRTLQVFQKVAMHLYTTIRINKGNPQIDDSEVRKALQVDENILLALRKFTPIKDVRFNSNINIYSDSKQHIIDNIKLEFFVNDSWYPWSYLSDGTKRLFYIVSEITDSSSGIILIEEPELGVHPHQFHLLMSFIKEESAGKQIILSTHSPQTLDHLELDELDKIIIATHDIDTGTKMRHLNEEEKEKAKEYVQEVGYLSDYWLHSDLEV
ncbi:AAA family ATPase [Parapedobacter sp. 2B3]|uniref:AAA family ATPase n=1 Tax=Parapedobacter sp. 2B3 TaxID=3342381 RepID=UPI0035B633DA